MPQVLIGVGSNLGDRQSIVDVAAVKLQTHLSVTSISKWFTYPAIGGPGEQEDFLNGAIVAETELSADDVRQLLHRIEREAGRERITRWSSRTLDCDLLLYGDHQIEAPDLQVPHPRMMTRRFVLEPANDIASDMIHPYSGWSIGKLFQHLQTAPPYFSVLSSDRVDAERIAHEVVEATKFQMLELSESSANEVSTTDTSLELSHALEWQQRGKDALSSVSVRPGIESQTKDERGWVSTFWIWEPWLRNASLQVPDELPAVMEPKLLVVRDTKQSEFRQWFSKLDSRLRVPTLFLSDDPNHAIQDAVGAVLSMTM